jgi:hypothetical protein
MIAGQMIEHAMSEYIRSDNGPGPERPLRSQEVDILEAFRRGWPESSNLWLIRFALREG